MCLSELLFHVQTFLYKTLKILVVFIVGKEVIFMQTVQAIENSGYCI